MARFDYFVIFAEMRTGSNFLEKNLQGFDGLNCYGEAFNPAFVGYPNATDILGFTKATRDTDPKGLLRAIRKDPTGLSGFRYFHNHDPRVFDKIVDDPKCAKIILTRNPMESYVSWKIAQATGQWKLTDAKSRKDARAEFDGAEFAEHVDALQTFQITLLNRLQVSGQTAFYVAYEDLQNVEVMNGIAQFLGIPARLEGLDKTLKRQNPSPMSEKVANFGPMRQALAEMDPFNLTRTPNFEPRRGPAVPTWVTAPRTPLLYMPLRGALDDSIETWLARLDGASLQDLGRKRTQNDLRAWMQDNPGHRGFTILRHPLDRAHDAFCHRILNTGDGGYPVIRATLRDKYKVPLPDAMPDPGYDKVAHRAAFLAFLRFVKANLAEQTSVRVDPAWATQSKTLAGFAEFKLPDVLLREAHLPEGLRHVAEAVGCKKVPAYEGPKPTGPFTLGDVYDAEIEKIARDVYGRDYQQFGYADWRA